MAEHKVTSFLLWGLSLLWIGKLLLGLYAIMMDDILMGHSFRILVQPLAWLLVLRCGGFHVLLSRKCEGKALAGSLASGVARLLIDVAILLISIYADYVLVNVIPGKCQMPLISLFILFDFSYCGVVYCLTKNYVSLVFVALKSLKQNRSELIEKYES